MKTTKSVKRRRTTMRRKRGGGTCDTDVNDICDFVNKVSMQANGPGHEIRDCGNRGNIKMGSTKIKVSQDIAKLKGHLKNNSYELKIKDDVESLLREYYEKYISCIGPNSSRTSESDLPPGSEQSTSLSEVSPVSPASNSTESNLLTTAEQAKQAEQAAKQEEEAKEEAKKAELAKEEAKQEEAEKAKKAKELAALKKEKAEATKKAKELEKQAKQAEAAAKKAKDEAAKAELEKLDNDNFKKNVCKNLPDTVSSQDSTMNNVVYFKGAKVYTDIKELTDELNGKTVDFTKIIGSVTTMTKVKVLEKLYNRINKVCPGKMHFFEEVKTGGRRKRTTKRR